MSTPDFQQITTELLEAKTNAHPLETFTSRYPNFTLNDGYMVGDQLSQHLVSQGFTPNGRKVGFSNPAGWSRLGIDNIVWAYTYDKTVEYFPDNSAKLALTRLIAPKIEPEIVFKLGTSLPVSEGSSLTPAQILEAVEWMALGFEIVDCPYPSWQYMAADMVASFGYHVALLIGQPLFVAGQNLEVLAAQLGNFSLKLSKNSALAAEGVAANVLGSPLFSLEALAILASTSAPLQLGEVVTSGTITDAQFITSGESWTAQIAGLALPDFSIDFS
jgi:2-oxo-3-hexenedioate decarboxylase